jgi:hypothetical protein
LNQAELPELWKELIIIPMYKKGNKTVCSNYSNKSLLPSMYQILSTILLSRLTPYGEEKIGDHQYGFGSSGQLLIIYSTFIKYLRKN